MSAIGILAIRFAALRALVLAVFAALLPPNAPMSHDAPAIADAIAATVAADPHPIWSTDIDSAVETVFVFYESGISLHPLPAIDPRSGKPVDEKASGMLQLHSWAGHADARTQSLAWRELLHAGAKSCAISPAAPLSGSCGGAAMRLADRRVALAMRLVVQIQSQAAASAPGVD